MKKILIITADYLPFHSPNSSCIEAILKEMKNKYEIDILTARKSSDSKKIEVIEGMNIYRADNWYLLSTESLNNSKNTKLKKLYKKSINRVSRSLLWPDIAFGWLGNAKVLAKELLNKNDYNTVISVSLPFTSHLVGLEIKKKNPDINWITYDLDPFADNDTYLGLKYKLYKNRNKKAEKKVMKYADALTMTSDLYRYNLTKKTFNSFKEKTVELPIPLLQKKMNVQPTKIDNKIEKHKINLVYSGLLYNKIRNPEYLFELLSKLDFTDKYKFNFYGSSNDCHEIVRKFKEKIGENFIVHGHISKEESIEAVWTADILINIGNTVSHQVPSKIFEYMATGKPIINIYSSENDTSKFYLDKYGNSLNLKTDWNFFENNLNDFREFCESSDGKVIPFEEISCKLFDNTPERSLEILSNIIDNKKAANKYEN